MRSSTKIGIMVLLLSVAHSARAEPLQSKFGGENVIWLTGPYIDDSDLLDSENERGDAMVCGMKYRTSTLSVRAMPDAASDELAVAPYLAVMHLTGELDPDKTWAKVEAFSVDFTTDGRRLAEASRSRNASSGWVSTDYLCNFVDM